ncbi:MAG TPA: Gfo/Idh/MocA family oxidoreductase, partial [Longimicrobiales bacterium]|nr:Gfo/Idh/MocA family oxidoreductase [Longimicrobiales bacterium]
MSDSPLGFAIVGPGMVAGIHARALARIPGARLVGIVSRNPERGAAFAAEHGIPAVTATVEEMVARPDVDAVVITTPSGAHLEPALAAVRAGKHIVIEKPIEITTARADRIIQAADAAGVKVAAIFQARFGDGARAVRAALDAGRFGRLVLCSAYIKWHRPAAYYDSPWKGTLALDGGGALINQGIHGVDLLQWFAGLPDRVSAWSTRRVHQQIEAEDTVVAALRFASGALGTIEASTAVWPGWSRRIEICGEYGSVCLEDDAIVQWEFAREAPEDEKIRRARENALGSGAGDPGAISILGHQRQLEDFVAAIREGRAPVIDAREARRAVALVNAV